MTTTSPTPATPSQAHSPPAPKVGGISLASLSHREVQVLNLLLKGYMTTSIGTLLGLSSKTVSTIRTRLYDKLGLRYPIGSSCNASLFAFARTAGLIEFHPLPVPPPREKSERFIASVVKEIAR